MLPAEAAEVQSSFRRPKPSTVEHVPLPRTAPSQERYGLVQLNRVIKALRKKTGANNLPLMAEQEFRDLLQPDSSVLGLLFPKFSEWYVSKVKNIQDEDNKKKTV